MAYYTKIFWSLSLLVLLAILQSGCDPQNALSRLVLGAGQCESAASDIAECCSVQQWRDEYPIICDSFGVDTDNSVRTGLIILCDENDGRFVGSANTDPLPANDASDMDCNELLARIKTLITPGGDCDEDCDDNETDGDQTDGDLPLVCEYDGQECDDNDGCTQTDTCKDGVCVGSDPLNCQAFDGVCTVGVCENGECKGQPARENENCEDSNACTWNTTCHDGVCTGETKNCDDNIPCTIDTCNAESGDCEYDKTTMEGQDCDDGNPCTVGGTCTAGRCVPEGPVDCSEFDDSCNTGVCGEDGCYAKPKENGLECNDENACTSPDECFNGVCSGNMKDCEDNEICTEDDCNPLTGECINDGAPHENDSCDDNDLCTEGDICVGGKCEPGDPKDCSEFDAQCTYGACQDGSCSSVWRSNGTDCTDDDACTLTSKCQNGECSNHTERVDCSDDDPCTDDICDPLTAECSNPESEFVCIINTRCYGEGYANPNQPLCSVCDPAENPNSWTPTNEGGDCSVSACHINDHCESGVCIYEMKPCPSTDPCQRGQCSLGSGECEFTTQGMAGTVCNDEDSGTLNDTCDNGGNCAGTEPPLLTSLATGQLVIKSRFSEDVPALYVCVQLTISHNNPTELFINLTSPTGTAMSPVLLDYPSTNIGEITRQTQQFAGESRKGIWTLFVQSSNPIHQATVDAYELTFAQCPTRSDGDQPNWENEFLQPDFIQEMPEEGNDISGEFNKIKLDVSAQ